jgi:hypothetical protein
MYEISRRSFLKKLAVTLASFPVVGSLFAEKLVAKEVSHDLGVYVSRSEVGEDKMLVAAWDYAKKFLDNGHTSSIWKGKFVPSKAELISEHDEYHETVGRMKHCRFRLTGVEIQDEGRDDMVIKQSYWTAERPV